MKKTIVKERFRLVLGYRSQFDLYLQNFHLPPNQALRLRDYTQLIGKNPEEFQIVLLPDWESQANIQIVAAIDFWKKRWKGLGIESMAEIELIGGLPVRQARLLVEYDKQIESIGISIFSQSSARDWIVRLSGQDSQLLLDALNERKTEMKKKIKKLEAKPNFIV